MKKALIAGILGIAVIGGGAYAMTDEKPKEALKKEQTEKEEPKTETTATVEVKEEKPTAPTERTKPISGKPWEAYDGIEVIDKVAAGEVVYLYEDGEALETELLNFVKSSSTGKKDWWHNQTMMYIGNVSSHYPEKKAYFDKLKEVADALKASNFGVIPSKIEEAKTLRAK